MKIETHSWYHRRHHRSAGGFRNIWGTPRDVPFLKSSAWLLGHAFRRKENVPPPVRPVAPEALQRVPARMRLTWLGHSSLFVQVPGLNLLVDPVFSRRASPLPFAGPDRKPGLPLEAPALPGVDVVLLSHDHYDHFDVQSLRALDELYAPLFLAPLGVGGRLRALGAGRVLELDWWQFVTAGGMRYHCTPAKHFSGRSLTDRNRTLWAGWYLEGLETDLRLYYAGDTAYADLFEAVRDHLGAPEVAVLPVGAYRPRWFMADVHVDPEEAVRAFVALQADYFIPVHWGTFDLAEEPIQEPAALVRQHAAAHGVAGRLRLLDIGESFALPPLRPVADDGSSTADAARS